MNILKKGMIFTIGMMAWVLARFTKWVPFPFMSEYLSLRAGRFGRLLRYQYYRRTLQSCGSNVTFPLGVHLSYPDIHIGNNVRLGHFSALGKVDIGDNVLIAAFCFIPSGGKQHGFERTDIPIMEQPGAQERIRIGDDVWIGANSVVMADVGQGSVIGAGSVITKPIPPFSIATGNPATVIRSRRESIP